ncbi:MAG: TonB-dependent receptor plug domain-containing protein, partial [Opitutaceae bacterium]
MNSLNSRLRALLLTSALGLMTVGHLTAQTTAKPVAPKLDDDEAIVLSPFVVSAAEDAGYTAKNTLAGTRVRTELKDVGSAISVVTAKFLQDTNSKNSADLLVYTTGTEVAGQGGNFAGGGDGAIIADGSYVEPVANTRVRGLAAADNLRDFFLTDIPWDSYNVGRVDLQRGPNS